jgi:hypothetical protein
MRMLCRPEAQIHERSFIESTTIAAQVAAAVVSAKSLFDSFQCIRPVSA